MKPHMPTLGTVLVIIIVLFVIHYFMSHRGG